MIYIDPPYNTGNDFIYPDNFRDSIKNYMELTGQTDGEGRKLSTNPETSGRFHTDWLNMMYPRLKLARNLLGDDGVIFVSIDDNEVANLRKICDEVFGEENLVGSFVWRRRSSSALAERLISTDHEYVVAYQRSDFTSRGTGKGAAPQAVLPIGGPPKRPCLPSKSETCLGLCSRDDEQACRRGPRDISQGCGATPDGVRLRPRSLRHAF